MLKTSRSEAQKALEDAVLALANRLGLPANICSLQLTFRANQPPELQVEYYPDPAPLREGLEQDLGAVLERFKLFQIGDVAVPTTTESAHE